MKGDRRHAPLRSCVVCGTKTSKRELARMVATPQGDVAIDPTGRMPGRGAYVCRSGKCGGKGPTKGRVEHALRVKMQDETWQRLVSSVESLRMLS